eukprot:TRINITY_DN5554_c0_g1_i1.p1 TRINITY_DN5554_c0_g1~~TRINITY_DN5554_c0_g1_i1.p1  ORF type:complete len:560 (+),score=109.56 TRINITY_DN5554_c0_g1_i1:51-1730(+)
MLNENQLDYSEINTLGGGQFGKVYKGQCLGTEVAVKVAITTNGKDYTQQQLEDFKNEVTTMKDLQHERLARLMGAVITPKAVKIVTELLADFKPILFKEKTLYQRMVYARQVAEGLAWMHGLDKIHSDLKTDNLLYDEKTDSVKICDFGFTISLDSAQRFNKPRGSWVYVAPEMWIFAKKYGLTSEAEKFPYTKQIDTYAYGILMAEFITGKSLDLKEIKDEEDLKTKVTAENGPWRPPIPKNEYECPKSLRTLVELCWHAEPEKRPQFSEILESFNTILVDTSIFEEKTRKFWTENFVVRSKKGNKVRRVVEFTQFIRRFCKLIGITSLTTRDALYHALEYLFAAKGTKQVLLEHFGKVIGHYGPVEKGKWWPIVMETINYPYFFGSISANEAVTLLEFAEPGEFLVRYSRSHGNWVISWVHPSRQLYHTPISHSYCSDIWSVSEQNFLSINQVIDAHKNHWVKPVVLMPPCSAIFKMRSSEEQNDFKGGYQSMNSLKDLLVSPHPGREDSPNMTSPRNKYNKKNSSALSDLNKLPIIKKTNKKKDNSNDNSGSDNDK